MKQRIDANAVTISCRLLLFLAPSFLHQYCTAGVLLGLPLSIHKKSYWPVTLAAVAGTAADFKEARTIPLTKMATVMVLECTIT